MRPVRKCCEASLVGADGVVFRVCIRSENHPVLAIKGMLRGIFLIARPPLLAVMQGGEYACPNHSATVFHSTSRPPLQEVNLKT
jgi:hypothetical protein